MKILHVCESLQGGVGSYLDEILPTQQDRYGKRNIALLAPKQHAGYLNWRDDNTYIGYDRTGRNLASIERLQAALRRQIKREQPDILHLHSSVAGAVGRFVAASTVFKGRVVYCAHGWSIDPCRRSTAFGAFASVERALYAATDAIVNISPHELEFLPASWRRGGRLRLIQSGIGSAPPAEPSSDEPSDGQRVWRLLFVGRTDHQKGFDLLVDEMAALAGSAHLTVIGGAVIDKADEPIQQPNVTMLGWRPRQDIAEHMRKADFVVMPSRWEGMPIVALEAMRAGRPLIASARGPFPHIVKHRQTGLLVDIEEQGFLGRALARVSRSDVRTMGAAAREAFEQRFTSGEMNTRLMKLYEELTSRQPQRMPAWAAALSPQELQVR